MRDFFFFFLINTHFIISLSLSLSLSLSNLRSHTILSLSHSLYILAYSHSFSLLFFRSFLSCYNWRFSNRDGDIDRRFRLRRSSQEVAGSGWASGRNALPSWDTDSIVHVTPDKDYKQRKRDSRNCRVISRSSIIAQFLTLSLVTLFRA